MFYKKILNKKAQFYIVAIILLSAVIISIVTIVNYARTRPENIKFYDLSEEFENEAAKVIEYGTINQQDVGEKIDNFTEYFLDYAHEKDPELGLIYIYGNSTKATIVNYGKNSIGVITEKQREIIAGHQQIAESTITLQIGKEETSKKIVERRSLFSKISESLIGPHVKVIVSGKEYGFDLKGNQYFFIIFKSEKFGESYFDVK